MSRMLDLVRASALPFPQMTQASKGALRVPTVEMLEILVHLAEHNKIFGETARLTLAGWDEAVCKQIAADPATPKEILDYWLDPKNARSSLFTILLENSGVLTSKLAEAAAQVKGEFADLMIASPRVKNTPQLLLELSTNQSLRGTQLARVQALMGGDAPPAPAEEPAKLAPVESGPSAAAQPAGETVLVAQPAPTTDPIANPDANDPDAESALVAFFKEHASEIAADANKPFQPIGGFHEELLVAEEPKAAAAAASASPAIAGTAPAPAQPVAPRPAVHKKIVNPEDEKRGSVLQKIAKLDVKGRIQLAVKGTKEERSILIRDGTKIVSLAVLDSPKITDGEVEKFASQKNVLEAVLRGIPMKRRFVKNYAIVRNLVFNPRTPLDVALGLMKNLLASDLKHLAGNKEISETVRKLALRMFQQKNESGKRD